MHAFPVSLSQLIEFSDAVDNTPALCVPGFGFKYRRGQRLACYTFFRYFLKVFGAMSAVIL
jgi:hypothetical protein